MIACVSCLYFKHLSRKYLTSKKWLTNPSAICRVFFTAQVVSWGHSTNLHLQFSEHPHLFSVLKLTQQHESWGLLDAIFSRSLLVSWGHSTSLRLFFTFGTLSAVIFSMFSSINSAAWEVRPSGNRSPQILRIIFPEIMAWHDNIPYFVIWLGNPQKSWITSGQSFLL